MARIAVDFTGTDEGGAVHVPEGYYKLKVIKCVVGKVKSTGKNGIIARFMILGPNKTMQKTLSLEATALWKLRQFVIAMGYQAPASKLTLDTDQWAAREFGALLKDSPYSKNGETKISSDIEEYITLAELEALRGSRAPSNGATARAATPAAVAEEIIDESILDEDDPEISEALEEIEAENEVDDMELVDAEKLPF